MLIEILKLDVVKYLFIALIIVALVLFIRWLVKSTIREFQEAKSDD